MENVDEICKRFETYTVETPERMREVSKALSDGTGKIQLAAVKVLGTWGGDKAIEELSYALLNCYRYNSRFQLREAIVLELSTCIRGKDAQWLLQLFFAVQGMWNKHELLPAVIALPPDAARDLLFKECGSQERDNRHAAMKAIAHMNYPERNRILEIFKNDEDPGIRRAAEEFLGKITSHQIRGAISR
jgi:HEAT repeat protein